jgi:general secretion pathway protein M
LKKVAYTGIRCIGIFIGTLLTWLLVASLLIIPWWERNVFYQEKIMELSEQIQRFNTVAATIPALEKTLAELRANKELDAYYIKAVDGSMGGIALQKLVEDFIRNSKDTATSSAQILPPEEQPTAIKIGVRVRFSCSTDALWQILYDIEQSKPALIITDLTIRPMRQGPRRRRQGVFQDTVQELTVNMDISGYIKRNST